MEEQGTQVIGPEANGDMPELPSAGSILDNLRARRESFTADHVLDIPVPGWQGALGLRLQPLTPRDHARFQGQLLEFKTSPEKLALANANVLINGTREVLVRTAEETWAGFGDLFNDGEPVRIDRRLAELLRFEPVPTSARAVLYALFGGTPSPELAMDRVVGTYLEWASSAAETADEALLGE